MSGRIGSICPRCSYTSNRAQPGHICPEDGAVLVSPEVLRKHPDDRLIGRVLKDRYAVFDILGVGGFGSVYRVHDHQLNLEMALKTIHHIGWDDPADSIGRFLQEAELLSRLQSPRIVAVYDADIVDGVLFMVLELIHGHSLKALLQLEGPQSLTAAASLIHQILEGLEHAHAHGLIHRDLKPANLLIEQGEIRRLKIIDFGVAKVLGQPKNSGPNTATGLVLGTVRYMAPEQLKVGSVVGPAADLYAVGLIMYELLVGRSPFHGSPAEIAAAHLYEMPPQLPPSVASVELEQFFNRSVAKSVNDRFTSATEMRLALIDCLPEGIRYQVLERCPAPDTESVSSKKHAFIKSGRKQSSNYDTALDLSFAHGTKDDSHSSEYTMPSMTRLDTSEVGDGSDATETTARSMPSLETTSRPSKTAEVFEVAPMLLPISDDELIPSPHPSHAHGHDAEPGKTNDDEPIGHALTLDHGQDDSYSSGLEDIEDTLGEQNTWAHDNQGETPHEDIIAAQHHGTALTQSSDTLSAIPLNRVPGISWWLRPVLILVGLMILLTWLHLGDQTRKQPTLTRKAAVNVVEPTGPWHASATRILTLVRQCNCQTARQGLATLPADMPVQLRAELVEAVQRCSTNASECPRLSESEP